LLILGFIALRAPFIGAHVIELRSLEVTQPTLHHHRGLKFIAVGETPHPGLNPSAPPQVFTPNPHPGIIPINLY
ncbi:MAG: hypothetical protein ACP5KB_03695, partial [Thermoprotei archaeon]